MSKGRLTKEKIKVWRMMANQPGTDYGKLLDVRHHIGELCDLALQSLSQEAVREEALGGRLTQGEFERRYGASLEEAARELHPATATLVRDFSLALAHKLLAAEKKYGYSDGWLADDWMDECRAKLREHVEKGDPRDVAAYCAFLWYHKESTALKREPNAAAQASGAWKQCAECGAPTKCCRLQSCQLAAPVAEMVKRLRAVTANSQLCREAAVLIENLSRSLR